MKRSLSIYLGNLFEHYDRALYSFLSPFFATLFFPEKEALTGLIMAFAIAPLGLLARPLGALVIGYVGDVRGRVPALFLSLFGMSIVTASMGMIPGYNQLGWRAPLLLLCARLMQNFFAAGETIGGALCLIEETKSEQKKDLVSGLFSSSTVLGILLASSAVALLYSFDAVERGWRFLYLGGSLTAFFAALLRRGNLPKQGKMPSFRTQLSGLWEMRWAAFPLTIASGFSHACYGMAIVLMGGFVPHISSFTVADVAKQHTPFLILDFAILPLFGLLGARLSAERMMRLAAWAAVLGGIPLFALLQDCTFTMLIVVRCALIIIGVCFSATYYSWSQRLVPPAYRYTLIGLCYTMGSLLFGDATTTAALWLYKRTGASWSAPLFWMALAFFMLLYLRRPKWSHSAIATT